jgi:hypothetical protein
MIRLMQEFNIATALDLNMDYCQIKQDADAQNPCTVSFISIGITQGYQHRHDPGVFQNFMSKFVQNMEHEKTNVDDF